MLKEKIETSEKSIHKRTVIRLAMSLLLAGLAARWSIPYALSMRGYFAIGGEYCLIVGMSALPWLFQRHYVMEVTRWLSTLKMQ